MFRLTYGIAFHTSKEKPTIASVRLMTAQPTGTAKSLVTQITRPCGSYLGYREFHHFYFHLFSRSRRHFKCHLWSRKFTIHSYQFAYYMVFVAIVSFLSWNTHLCVRIVVTFSYSLPHSRKIKHPLTSAQHTKAQKPKTYKTIWCEARVYLLHAHIICIK